MQELKKTDDKTKKAALDRFACAYEVLTTKQKLFVDGRLQGLPVIAAAHAAGYQTEHGHQLDLERHLKIKAALDAASRDTLNKLMLNREEVINGMMDAVHTSATATELVLAWREIGKLIGAYEPQKVEHTIKIEKATQEQLSRMTDAELIKRSGHDDFRISDDDIIDAEFDEMVDAAAPLKEIEYGTDKQ